MPAHYIQANTNGRLHPATEPSLSPLNRGYLYGDAIYEVWRTYRGVLFGWSEHWTRLRASAAALHFTWPFTPESMLAEIRRTVTAYRAATGDAGELYIRLQITRGAGPIGLDVALADHPDFVLLVQPCPTLAAEATRRGLRLSVATGLRRNPVQSLNPAWKTGNYLNNLLCLREARLRGADEVVILNLAGEVTEASVCNLAFIRDGVFITPPLSAGILGGITRGMILGGIAAAAGVPAREETVRPSDWPTIQECLLLSTTKDIAPVASIDDANFTVGPGTVGSRLKAAYDEAAGRHAAAHPELAV